MYRVTKDELLDIDASFIATPSQDPDASLRFEVLGTGDYHVLARPAIVLGDECENIVQRLFQRRHSPPLWSGFVHVREGIVCSDNLTFHDGRVLTGRSLMYHPLTFPQNHSGVAITPAPEGGWNVEPPGVAIRLPGRTASLVCNGWQIYGHWIVDVLPRLHRLLTNNLAIDQFLFPGPCQPWQRQFIDLLGIKEDKLRFVDLRAGSVQCEHLILPTFARFNSGLLPEVSQVCDLLIQRAQAMATAALNQGTYLFVSRSTWGGSRSLTNREEVENAFIESGFEIVRPESYSVVDQIAMMTEATVVVGEAGSGLHNTAFCPPGTRVGVIQSTRNESVLQAYIGVRRKHTTFYLTGASDGPSEAASYTVDVHAARRLAEIMIKDRR